MNALDRAQPYIIGALFVAAGALHFKNPAMYESIVPPYLPARAELVAVSGFFEMLGGAGAAIAPTRRAAGIGLIALLVAVFRQISTWRPTRIDSPRSRRRGRSGPDSRCKRS
jgi:uncharacterized membrane protein